jgi:hypothetical protein
VTPAVDRVVRCALRLPSARQVRALRAAGWVPAEHVGTWCDATASGRVLWWEHAVALAATDAARNAGAA